METRQRAQGLEEPGQEGHRETEAKGVVEPGQSGPQLCFSLGTNRGGGAREGAEIGVTWARGFHELRTCRGLRNILEMSSLAFCPRRRDS